MNALVCGSLVFINAAGWKLLMLYFSFMYSLNYSTSSMSSYSSMYIIPLLPLNRGCEATVHWNFSIICIFWLAVACSLSATFTVNDERLFPVTAISSLLKTSNFLYDGIWANCSSGFFTELHHMVPRKCFSVAMEGERLVYLPFCSFRYLRRTVLPCCLFTSTLFVSLFHTLISCL